MRSTCILVTVVAMTSASYAADPPKISIESLGNAAAALEASGVDVRVAGDVSLVRMRLGLVSASGTSQIARIGLALPDNARVVGMQLSQPGQSFTAERMTTSEARGEFDEHKAWFTDPALLEWQSDSAGRRRLQLLVSPLSDRPSTVTVTFAIPHLQRLVVDLAGWERTIPRAAFVQATPEEAELAKRPEIVTREQSLYAGPTDPLPTQDNVQRLVRDAYPRLRLCYDNSQAHDAVMHFKIANGQVRDFSLEGVAERTAGCVAEELAGWRFRLFDGEIRVNYPLHFIPLIPVDPSAARRQRRQAEAP